MLERTYNKEVNAEKLTAELVDAGLEQGTRFFGVSYDSGSVIATVYVADDFTQQEAATCDAVVAAHVPLTLAEAKADRNDQVDQKTRDIIARGAPYDGHMFSQDIPDQLTYIFLFTAVSSNQVQYPIEVRDMDQLPYYLADANAFYTFYFTGGAYIQGVLAGGRQIKDEVNACTTIDCVNSIVDPRT